jgi:hypothetical protein
MNKALITPLLLLLISHLLISFVFSQKNEEQGRELMIFPSRDLLDATSRYFFI